MRNDLISTRVIEGETILFNTENHSLHVLNPVASEIWNCCDGEHTFGEIVERLFDKFEASRNQIGHDVKKTLLQFQELELLEDPQP